MTEFCRWQRPIRRRRQFRYQHPLTLHQINTFASNLPAGCTSILSSPGLSGGAIAGVVIGVILGVIVLGGVAVLGLSYLGVISGPIPARTASPSAGLSSSAASKGGSTGFGFTNNLYDNPDDGGVATVSSGDSVAFHADMDV